MISKVVSWQWLVGAIIWLLVPGRALSQDTQTGSVAYLQTANGFKSLKLGEQIKLIPGYKMSYMDGNNMPDADSCYRYLYQDDDILQLANGLKLDRVGFRAYNNQIVEIYLFFNHQDGYKVLKTFTDKFGTCSNRPTDFTYIWNTGDVSLSLRYREDLDLGVAVFSSNKLEHILQQNTMKTAATQKAIASSVSIAGN